MGSSWVPFVDKLLFCKLWKTFFLYLLILTKTCPWKPLTKHKAKGNINLDTPGCGVRAQGCQGSILGFEFQAFFLLGLLHPDVHGIFSFVDEPTPPTQHSAAISRGHWAASLPGTRNASKPVLAREREARSNEEPCPSICSKLEK